MTPKNLLERPVLSNVGHFSKLLKPAIIPLPYHPLKACARLRNVRASPSSSTCVVQLYGSVPIHSAPMLSWRTLCDRWGGRLAGVSKALSIHKVARWALSSYLGKVPLLLFCLTALLSSSTTTRHSFSINGLSPPSGLPRFTSY